MQANPSTTPKDVASSLWKGAPFILGALQSISAEPGQQSETLEQCLKVFGELSQGASPFYEKTRPRPEVALALVNAAELLGPQPQFGRLVPLIRHVADVVCGTAIGFAVGELALSGNADAQRMWQAYKSGDVRALQREDFFQNITACLRSSDLPYAQQVAPAAAKWFALNSMGRN